MQSRIAAIYQYWCEFCQEHIDAGLSKTTDPVIWSLPIGEHYYWFNQFQSGTSIQIEVSKKDAKLATRHDILDMPAKGESRLFDFHYSGLLIELNNFVEDTPATWTGIVMPHDPDLMVIIDELYLKTFQKKIRKQLESNTIPSIFAEEITIAPSEKNPLYHDTISTIIGTVGDIDIIHSPAHENLLLLVNNITGRRAEVDFSGLMEKNPDTNQSG